jgi:hypothetical protein
MEWGDSAERSVILFHPTEGIIRERLLFCGKRLESQPGEPCLLPSSTFPWRNSLEKMLIKIDEPLANSWQTLSVEEEEDVSSRPTGVETNEQTFIPAISIWSRSEKRQPLHMKTTTPPLPPYCLYKDISGKMRDGFKNKGHFFSRTFAA